MTIFAVIGPPDNTALKSRVEAAFTRFLEFAPNQFVVSETGITATQAGEKIGTDNVAGLFVVFPVSNYFGYHKKELWEWMKVNSSE
ncbi:hypothetical protein [Taklimakanibacter lacteus]|uniref:hypothetical protein n=1 Tax=Taklimakanibacter lacteus TaxID=2268456 RepID=UPI000E674B4F